GLRGLNLHASPFQHRQRGFVNALNIAIRKRFISLRLQPARRDAGLPGPPALIPSSLPPLSCTLTVCHNASITPGTEQPISAAARPPGPDEPHRGRVCSLLADESWSGRASRVQPCATRLPAAVRSAGRLSAAAPLQRRAITRQ